MQPVSGLHRRLAPPRTDRLACPLAVELSAGCVAPNPLPGSLGQPWPMGATAGPGIHPASLARGAIAPTWAERRPLVVSPARPGHADRSAAGSAAGLPLPIDFFFPIRIQRSVMHHTLSPVRPFAPPSRRLFLRRWLASVAAPLCLALLPAAPAWAQGAAAPAVSDAWARPTVAGQGAGGGFLTLRGGAAADRLLSASSPVAQRVELHTMRMEGNVMRMHEVDAIEVPAGATVELAPGGLHVMFMGLQQPLATGQRFPLTLRFERGGEVEVMMEVAMRPGAAPGGRHGAGHGGHRH
jgi:periplasmic copper chaperone A